VSEVEDRTDLSQPQPRERRAARSRWLDLVMGVELVAIVVFGVFTVARFPIWSPIDEGAHYAYVQEVAEHGRLPILGKTHVSSQVDAITQHQAPSRLLLDPFIRGLEPQSYEAFQPPLYYAVASPIFLAVPGYLNKVYALRSFDLVLLVAAAVLALQLCRTVLGANWRFAGPLVLSVFLLPGLVVRSVTVSNAALELPLALLFFVVFARTWDKPTTRRLLVLSVVLAACLLTQLILVALIPLWAAAAWRWWAQHMSRDVYVRLRTVVIAGLVPVALLAPWFAFNEAHYHALTAGKLAMRMQTDVVNPQHLHFALHLLPDDTVNRLWALLLPQEWTPDLFVQPRPFIGWVNQASGTLLIPLLGIAMLAAGRRFMRSRTALLVVPYLVTTVSLWWVSYRDQWFVMLPRYTYPTLVAWVVAGAAALGVMGGRRFAVALGSLWSVVIVASWVSLTRSFL
jgi:hypothetical protein